MLAKPLNRQCYFLVWDDVYFAVDGVHIQSWTGKPFQSTIFSLKDFCHLPHHGHPSQQMLWALANKSHEFVMPLSGGSVAEFCCGRWRWRRLWRQSRRHRRHTATSGLPVYRHKRCRHRCKNILKVFYVLCLHVFKRSENFFSKVLWK